MSKFWSTAVKRTDPYVPGEQLDQPDILKLNTNENPYPPPPAVSTAITEEAQRALQLYPPPSADSLREEIAKQYGLARENVFAGNGSDEVLAFSFMAFFEPGKAIRFPQVTYSFYPVYAKLFGIPFEEVPLEADFTIRETDYFHSEGGVIFPNPNAPTGVYMDLSKVRKIAENNADQVVIADEAYIDFALESAVSLTRDFDNVLVVQTMSKSRSLAGLRVGFAFGHPDLIEGLVRIKDSFNSYTLDRLAIAGAVASLREKEHFQETTARIVHTREWVNAQLKEHGFHIIPSAANFIFARHQHIPADALYKQLKAKNVLVRHFNMHPIENYLRITIGTDEEMTAFFGKLSDILEFSRA